MGDRADQSSLEVLLGGTRQRREAASLEGSWDADTQGISVHTQNIHAYGLWNHQCGPGFPMEGMPGCHFLSVPGEVRLGTKGIITFSASDFHQDQKDRAKQSAWSGPCRRQGFPWARELWFSAVISLATRIATLGD